jgi:hypothetical protein
MRALLLAIGVLALAAVFGLSEPAPAAGEPVAPDELQLVREQSSEPPSSHTAGKNGNGRKSTRIRTARG